MCCKGNGLIEFCTRFSHLIKVQKLALLKIKMRATCIDEELLNEMQIDLKNMLTTLISANTMTTFTTYKSVYELMMWQTSLHGAMRNISTFNPRNNVNCFITDLNSAYMLHVKLELAISRLDSRRSKGRCSTHYQWSDFQYGPDERWWLTPLFFHTHLYETPIQPSVHLFPFVRIPFTVKVTTIFDITMLGSGCSICIVPVSQLPKEARKHMTYSDIHMKGINNNTNYELDCDIAIGNHDSPFSRGSMYWSCSVKSSSAKAHSTQSATRTQ